MRLRCRYLHVVAVSALVLATGCGQRNPPSGTAAPTGLHVVAVERVYGDLARQLAGSAVDVRTILDDPAGDPHEYEPTARDADAIANADIVVRDGLGYDAFVDALLRASPRPGRVVLDAGAIGGYVVGANPHVWYDGATLARVLRALATELARRLPEGDRPAVARRHEALAAWVRRYRAEVASLGHDAPGASVATTEPVYYYVLHGGGVRNLTPPSFSRAVENGTDPSPQDVATMSDLVATKKVAALVYNVQTVDAETTRLRESARAHGVPVVPVTETLPLGTTTQRWLDGEVAALAHAL